MPTHKYIKFTGQYNKLKSMGYYFQKLYASNYMQWCFDKPQEYKNDTGIRIWKKGADLSIDRVVNHTGAFLEVLLNDGVKMRDKPLYGKPYGVVYTNRETGELTGDDTGYFNQQKAWGDACRDKNEELLDTLPMDWESVVVNTRMMDELRRLHDMGWIEVGEHEYTA